jgi:hypothetical protein
MTTESSSKNEFDTLDIIKRKLNKVSFLKSLNLANSSSNNNIVNANIQTNSSLNENIYNFSLTEKELNILEKSENTILKIPSKLKLKFKYADFYNFVKKTE